MEIEHSVGLVTGANRGLGRAFVLGLLERGAEKVYAGARNPEAVEVTDPRIVPLRLDVTNPEQIAEAVEHCPDVTVLVNNAGVAHPGRLLGPRGLSKVRADFETNTFGLLAMSSAFAPVLGQNGGGAIVNMLSMLSFLSAPYLGPYSASKAAGWSLTNGIRLELRPQGTQVVAVHCGYVDTDMVAEVDAPKMAAEEVAGQALAGLEAGELEVLVDELTQQIKAGLSADPRVLYPELG